MRLSQLEKIPQTSFSMLQAKLQQDTKRKRIDQRNTIKINRRKLPSDFFKGSVEKSLSKKSRVEPQFDRFVNQKIIYSVKQPQTERKIYSYQCLPSTDPAQINNFECGSSSGVRIREQPVNILHRKFLEKQVNSFKQKIKTSRFDKSIDCVKLKCPKQKQSGQKNQNCLSKTRKNTIKLANKIEEKNVDFKFEGFIDMGCTFGRGFKTKFDFSLQNSVMLKQNQQNNCQIVEEQIIQDQLFLYDDTNHKKEGFEKSTDQSQVFESSKSKQNSPIRQKNRKKILKLTGQTCCFDQLKSLTTQKKVMNHDLSFFNDLPQQNSKMVFTAGQKQRKIRNRINSSSTDQRSIKIRKDKKIQDLNLPKIGKVVSFRLDVNN